MNSEFGTVAARRCGRRRSQTRSGIGCPASRIEPALANGETSDEVLGEHVRRHGRQHAADVIHERRADNVLGGHPLDEPLTDVGLAASASPSRSCT